MAAHKVSILATSKFNAYTTAFDRKKSVAIANTAVEMDASVPRKITNKSVWGLSAIKHAVAKKLSNHYRFRRAVRLVIHNLRFFNGLKLAGHKVNEQVIR